MKSDTSPYKRFSWHKADYPRASIAYAKKEESRKENGSHGEYGDSAALRTDSNEDVVQQLLARVPLQQVIDAHPVISFLRNDKIIEMHNRLVPDRSECNVTLLIGPSGCGKTTWALKEALKDGYTAFQVPDRTRHNGRWDWKGYASQNTAIINEFDDTWLKVIAFKQFFDTFHYQIECKGDNFQMKSNNIFLTTNSDIKDWYAKYRAYPANAVHVKAMERRITQFFTIYDCRRNLAYGLDALEDAQIPEDRITTEPFMQMTLRAHPPGGFRFNSLQTSFALIQPRNIYNGEYTSAYTSDGQSL